MLDALSAEGWLDGAYRPVITSDHGEYLGEHRLVEHGRPYFYGQATRVPLLYFSTEGEVELPDDVPSIAVHSLAREAAPPSRRSPRRRSLPTPISAETAFADLGRAHHRSIDELLAKSLARRTM